VIVGLIRRTATAFRKTRALLRHAEDIPPQVEAMDKTLTRALAELDGVRDDVGQARSRLDQVAARADGTDAAIAELRDSVDLIARHTALQRGVTRVLFLVHVLGSWSSCRLVVEAMRDCADFEPIVASIPRRFRGSGGLYGEEDVHRGLTALGVPHLRFGADRGGDVLRLIKTIDPDIVFRQSQWDADVPDELGTQQLGFVRTCLIPYETMNIVVNVPDEQTTNSAVDSPYHRAAWLVFCANERVRDMAVRDGVLGGMQFRVVGHPKADHLRMVRPAWPLPDTGDDAARPGRVVWSAHHTTGHGWTDFGAFHLMSDAMYAWARQCSDLQFLFMPHPALLPFPGSEDSPITRREFDDWLTAWTALPNTSVMAEAEYAPALAASDVMVTDGLSMLIEYQLLEKPVIFFERPGHRSFNAIGEQVVRGVHTVHSIDEVRQMTDKFLSGEPDPLREQQQANVRELFGPPGSPARIIDVLRREIARERVPAR
jgi:hypothetical protein